VETWRDLLLREASRDNTAIDVSWLGRPRTALPRDEGWRGPVRLRQPAPGQIPVEQPSRTPIVLVSHRTGAEDALSAKAIDDSAAKLTPDMAAPDMAPIAERYPLLRNAL